MCLKKFLLFGLIAAVLPAVAEEAADRKTATSLKYVTHELDTRQNKFSADANKAMEYTDSAGTVQKRAVTSELGTSTSDTSLPMVGGVNTKLATKQDDIAPINDHTAVTYTGQSGSIGQKGIYQTNESYAAQSNNLIDAKTFNAALKTGLDSEFLCSEYKPGTDLCWVWSIHNNETTNLIDWSQTATHEMILSGVWTRYQVETSIQQGQWTCKHTSVPAGTYTVTVNSDNSQNWYRIVTYVNGQAAVSPTTGGKATVTLNEAGEIWVFCASDSQMATITQAQIVPGTSGEMLPYTTLVPAGYTPVEWIESNGTQYIDTDIKGHMNYTYELDFQQTDTGQYRNWGVFNQSTGQGQNMSFTWSRGWAVRWASAINGTDIVDLGSIDTKRHILRIVDGEIYFDGVDRGRSTGHDSSFVFNYNLFLGTINPGGTTPTTNAKSKYYSYKVWDANGDLIQNFVPARQNSDNKVGMYDTVSGRFFPSVPANTNFAAGPDISNIVYVPQNQ